LEAKCIYFLKLDKSADLYSMVNPHDTISLDEAVKSLEAVGYSKYQ